jgi:hypothetical protein
MSAISAELITSYVVRIDAKEQWEAHCWTTVTGYQIVDKGGRE